ncbi:hypothetical protein [Evansella cellulosilytica]|uniref:Spore coat protein n=1 Tax=Evansella cellulosilytica (strain ATCC 21833 / DSM 2522 / FERM P-1141 / JCM 9156 / N-4) TaxID=649639 RepID=E6TVY3_EVAC2|nr:hypothetical protein [Evansella cellulosilytica]ADU28692.1 spore coat protein [Evansella cellulosilytica DSM 2522]
MNNQGLAIHEKAELHEMLVFKTNCLNKSQVAQNMVQDTQLKSLLQQDVQASKQSITTLQGLLNQ